jgi:hypothetical protein
MDQKRRAHSPVDSEESDRYLPKPRQASTSMDMDLDDVDQNMDNMTIESSHGNSHMDYELEEKDISQDLRYDFVYEEHMRGK